MVVANLIVFSVSHQSANSLMENNLNIIYIEDFT